MDTVFSFSEAARFDFLQSAFHSYGCAYICLWSYYSSSNRLVFLDGLYDVQRHQASSSLGSSLDRRLFGQYRGLEFDITSENRIPGMAFWNQYSYLELQQSDLLRLAWTDIQRQFFQEARIETAVFIGCRNGEIELGFSSSVISQSAEMIQTDVLQNWFPEESSRQSHYAIPPPSSSSNSLISSSLQNNVVIPEERVISSAFKRYEPCEMVGNYDEIPNMRRQSMIKRSFELLRGLHFMRTREGYEASHHTSSCHFLHMLSERRRREKLNRHFQALRSLLPPETKKDKASILIAAAETLRSLMGEIEKMAKKGDGQVGTKAKMKDKEPLTKTSWSTSIDEERLISVRVSDNNVSSSSEERFIDLHVSVRRSYFLQHHQVDDILNPLLKFLKRVQRVTLISVDANTHIAQGSSINEVTLRLKIEGSEWDEGAFEEAVGRVVADAAK